MKKLTRRKHERTIKTIKLINNRIVITIKRPKKIKLIIDNNELFEFLGKMFLEINHETVIKKYGDVFSHCAKPCIQKLKPMKARKLGELA